jgi:hypothetical protein
VEARVLTMTLLDGSTNNNAWRAYTHACMHERQSANAWPWSCTHSGRRTFGTAYTVSKPRYRQSKREICRRTGPIVCNRRGLVVKWNYVPSRVGLDGMSKYVHVGLIFHDCVLCRPAINLRQMYRIHQL